MATSVATKIGSRSVILAGIRFETKAAAEKHIRSILNSYGQRQALTGDDLKVVVAILDSHPNRETIVDCGIKRIEVQHLGDRHGSRRFLLIRTDDSMRDFTWRHALYPGTAKARVMKACRYAVKDQISSFREKTFAGSRTLICEVSGLTITTADSDVDHIPPRTFERLVMAWLSSVRMVIEDVALVPSVGYQQPDRWEDEFLEENWKDYHRTHAHLRVVHSWANRSLIRKGENCGRDA